MRKLIVLALVGISISLLGSPPVPTTVTANITMQIDSSQLGGISTSQYGSNFTALIWSSVNINTPTNQYQLVSTVPAGPMIATQGPPGTVWTNQIATDNATRFYLLQWSNNVNGGVGPFSVVAPYYQNPSGTVSLH